MTRYTLKPLPYPQDALAPVMSGRTVQIHHGRFQVGYVETLNRLLHDTSHEHEDLELIILHTRSEPKARPVYNCASQLWNHEFFWESLAPDHAGEPPRTVARELISAFGGVDVFRGSDGRDRKAPFRQRLAVAVDVAERRTRHRRDSRRRESAAMGRSTFVRLRFVGTRVLPRLRAGSRAIRRSGRGPADQLGALGGEAGCVAESTGRRRLHDGQGPRNQPADGALSRLNPVGRAPGRRVSRAESQLTDVLYEVIVAAPRRGRPVVGRLRFFAFLAAQQQAHLRFLAGREEAHHEARSIRGSREGAEQSVHIDQQPWHRSFSRGSFSWSSSRR